MEEKVNHSDIISDFQKNAAELGVTIDDRMLFSFELYYKNLIEWNAVMNLTAITEEKDVYEKSGVTLEPEVIILAPDYKLEDKGPKVRGNRITILGPAETGAETKE